MTLMLPRQTAAALAALTVYACLCAAETGPRPPASGEVPIAVVRNHVLVPVSIQGTGPYSFALDLRISRAVIDAALADTLGLAQAKVNLSANGSAPSRWQGQVVSLDSVAFGTWPLPGETPAVVMDLDDLAAQLGEPVWGLLPASWLPDPFTLDCSQRRIEWGGLPPKDTSPLHVGEQGEVSVDAILNGRFLRRLEIDLSFGGVVALPRAAAAEMGIPASASRNLTIWTPNNASMPDGGVQVRIEKLEAGPTTFAGPVCVLREAGAPALGLGAFSRFRVTLSLGGRTIAWTPAGGSGGGSRVASTPIFGSGLAPGRFIEGRWTVHVAEESPADLAGVLPGESLDAVNGKPASELAYEEVARELMGREGGSIAVTLIRGKEPVTIEIPCVELL